MQRSRSYVNGGASITELNRTYYAPRIYASVGAQL
jgi:hypothetical protein